MIQTRPAQTECHRSTLVPPPLPKPLRLNLGLFCLSRSAASRFMRRLLFLWSDLFLESNELHFMSKQKNGGFSVSFFCSSSFFGIIGGKKKKSLDGFLSEHKKWIQFFAASLFFFLFLLTGSLTSARKTVMSGNLLRQWQQWEAPESTIGVVMTVAITKATAIRVLQSSSKVCPDSGQPCPT